MSMNEYPDSPHRGPPTESEDWLEPAVEALAPDDPRRLSRLVFDAITGNLPLDQAACDAALDLLGVTDSDDRARVSTFLQACAVKYQFASLGDISRPRGSELKEALASIAKAAKQIDGSLIVLRRARQTAMPDGGLGEEHREALFPLVVDAIQRSMGLPRSHWRGGFEDPFFGAFGRIAEEVGRLSAWFDEDYVKEPTRSQHPGLTVLVLELAHVFEEWTGKRPTAAQPSGRKSYRAPFVRFVHAFGPMAGVAKQLPAKTIAKALRLYPRIG